MNHVAPILLIPVPVLVAVALYLLFWQGYKLRRRISGFARLSLLVTVVAGQLPPVLVQLANVGVLGSASQVVVLGNAVLSIPAVGIACFRLAVLRRTPRDPAVRATIGAGIVLAAAIVSLGLIAIARGAPLAIGGAAVEAATDPVAAAFYVVSALGYGVVLIYVGTWILQYTLGSGGRSI